MIFPSELKIGAQRVKVTLKPLAEIDSDCNGGWARWEQNELLIASDIPEDRQALIFMHEIFHFMNVYLPEEQITFLTESFFQVLRDNQLQFLNTNVGIK